MPERARASAGRALWTGQISFGLVSVPVELYAAARRSSAPLRMLGPDGAPLVRQYVCPRDGRILSGDEIERGVEVGEGEFVIVTDEELEQLEPRRSREIDLERFVPRHEIDPAFFVRSYILVPGGEQTKAYRLLAETMESSERAAIASFVMRGRSYAVAIFADRGILRAETLRFGDEVRRAEELGLPEPEPVGASPVEAMAKRVEELAAPALDESELEDDSSERLRALARRKRERGEDVVEAPEETEEESDETAEVIDLMALLKRRMREKPRRGGEAKRGRRGGERNDGLESASKQELYRRARDHDIAGRSKMSREELLESLRRVG